MQVQQPVVSSRTLWKCQLPIWSAMGLNRSMRTLAHTDQRANSIIDSFDYSQAPIQFQPITSSHDKAYFMRRHPTNWLDGD